MNEYEIILNEIKLKVKEQDKRVSKTIMVDIIMFIILFLLSVIDNIYLIILSAIPILLIQYKTFVYFRKYEKEIEELEQDYIIKYLNDNIIYIDDSVKNKIEIRLEELIYEWSSLVLYGEPRYETYENYNKDIYDFFCKQLECDIFMNSSNF